MKDKIVLIDYEEKYADMINEIEEEQWGKWCTGDIRDKLETHTSIKLECNICKGDKVNGYKKRLY